MPVAVKKAVMVPQRTQLTFNFIAPEELRKIPTKRRKSKVKIFTPQEPIKSEQNPSAQHLQDTCRRLYELAKKHIPPTEIRDYTAFSQCAQVLFDQKVLGAAPPELNAEISDHDSALIIHAPQYRLLRNRAIAGLATVADLGVKAPAKGSPDYQRGVRDAYQHASDLAATFLEDVQNGV